MASYIEVPFETDPGTLAADALDTLIANIPGFVPREGNLEVWMVEVWARMVSEARIVAANVPSEIFRYFGDSLLGLPPVAALPAQATTTWTMVDNQGYTIPAGTVVAFRIAGDELVAFHTIADAIVSPGFTTVPDVVIEATELGADMNGLGPGGLELVDALSFVSSIVADGVTAGGVDAETDEAYLDRLASELQLLTPRPILAEDFAVLARRVAGVHRALAIDGYNPADTTYNNERMVTVALVDINGDPVAPAVATAVQTYLDAQREVNFIVNVIDPDYTIVNVVFTVVAHSNYDLADVEARAEAAVTAHLDPATWGGGDQSPPEWRPSTNVVRYLELAQAINEVDGVDFIDALTVNGGTVDVTLAGVAALPSIGTVDGTATYG